MEISLQLCRCDHRTLASAFRDLFLEVNIMDWIFLMWKQVSSNTGRIHLHFLDLDLPKPLGINFRPEDLENLRTGACEKGRSFPTWFVHSITHQDAAMSFWSQWNQLRPVIRKRLSGRPLLLPLSSELSCLKIQSQYTERVVFFLPFFHFCASHFLMNRINLSDADLLC